ncbi:MAG: hypothetical protein DMF90_27920 [Acidobacteria bacterium]|nr:MAG: hypothetical protein DMF90_27920 [Acidobacteriota bacterium]
MKRSRPGRPPLDDTDRESVMVNVRLPLRQYDAVWQRAQRERVTVPEWIRRSFTRPKKDT